MTDPFDYLWSFATHQKDLTESEMRRAGEAFAATMAKRAAREGSTRPGQHA